MSWGQNVVLATNPFASSLGTWYSMSQSFLTPGPVRGTVTGPGGVTATVSAADPGGPKAGDRVGFYNRTASSSFDDIQPALPQAVGPSS